MIKSLQLQLHEVSFVADEKVSSPPTFHLSSVEGQTNKADFYKYSFELEPWSTKTIFPISRGVVKKILEY